MYRGRGYRQDNMSNFTGSRYVNQYAGAPIDEYMSTMNVLQKKYDENKIYSDKLELMADQIQLSDVDEGIKNSMLSKIRMQQDEIAKGGAYEMAGDIVRKQAKDFYMNPELKRAQKSYANMQADMENFKNLSPAQKIKMIRAQNAYKTAGGAMGDADYNVNDYYEEQDLAADVMKLMDGFESDTMSSPLIQDGYIRIDQLETITPEEIRNAATRYLMADPQRMRQIEDLARYQQYQANGKDLGFEALDLDPYARRTVKGADGKEYETSYIQDAINNIVEPSVSKYSKRNHTLKISSDATYNANRRLAYDRSKDSPIPLKTGNQAVNFGNIPKTSGEYKQNMTQYKAQINNAKKGLEKAIANNDVKRIRQYTQQLEYFNGMYNSLDEYREKVLSSKFDLSTAEGREDKAIYDVFKNIDLNNYHNSSLRTDDFRNYLKEQWKALTGEEITGAKVLEKYRRVADFVKDDSWFSDSEFTKHLEEVYNKNAFSVNGYTLNEDQSKRHTQALKNSPLEFYGNDMGQLPETEKLKKKDWVVTGLSNNTPIGNLYQIQFTNDENNGEDAGATMWVKNVGVDNTGDILDGWKSQQLQYNSFTNKGGQAQLELGNAIEAIDNPAEYESTLLGLMPGQTFEIPSIGGDFKVEAVESEGNKQYNVILPDGESMDIPLTFDQLNSAIEIFKAQKLLEVTNNK